MGGAKLSLAPASGVLYSSTKSRSAVCLPHQRTIREATVMRMMMPSKPPATAPTMIPMCVPLVEPVLEAPAEALGVEAPVEVKRAGVDVPESPTTTVFRVKLLEALVGIILLMEDGRETELALLSEEEGNNTGADEVAGAAAEVVLGLWDVLAALAAEVGVLLEG